jgi:hypothetical protein
MPVIGPGPAISPGSGGALGVNLLLNPSFEFNAAGTPVNTPLTSGHFGDNWTVTASSPYWNLVLEQAGFANVGLNDAQIYYNGTTLPALMGAVSGAAIQSDRVAITPNVAYMLQAQAGWESNFALPSGIVVSTDIVFSWSDASDTYIAAVARHNVAPFTRWSPVSYSAMAPSNAAYLRVTLGAYIRNTNGSPYVNVGGNQFAMLRWDSLSLTSMAGLGLTSAAMPLAPPAFPYGSKVTIGMHNTVGESRSPSTGTRQVFQWPGEWLTASVELPQMTAANARAWIAFLAVLRGKSGTLQLADSSQIVPRGSVACVGVQPLFASSDAAGATQIHLSGFVPGAVLVLRSGDWFNFNDGTQTRLHMVLLDANADSSGNATVSIFPRLRAATIAGNPIFTWQAYGVFALASNDQSYTVDEAMMYGIKLDAVEAI